jgi:FAD/FMN-containing dehydrogenase
VIWADASTAAAEFGLAALAGSAPDIGVVGYTLGGGISWLARRHGLAANSVLAVEIVTADGRLVRAGHYHEPDLFWAIRGGGGGLGIVTALEFGIDTVATIPAVQLARLHMDPDGPVPGAGDGMLFDELPAAAITALLATAGHDTGSPLLSVEFRHLGGALSEITPQAGALASIEATYAMYAVGMAVTPDVKHAIENRVDLLRETLSPWQSRHGYLNFNDRPGDADRLFPRETYRRLQNIKAAYDPGDLFLSNHPITPAT